MKLPINTTRFWSLSTQVSITLWILCQDGTKCCHTGKILRYTIVIEIETTAIFNEIDNLDTRI